MEFFNDNIALRPPQASHSYFIVIGAIAPTKTQRAIALQYQPQVFLPVPGTVESSAAFPCCVNVPSPGFLLTIALDNQYSPFNRSDGYACRRHRTD